MTSRHDMQQDERHSRPATRVPRVGAASVIAIVAASIAAGSCLFTSATNVCESGLRCAPGLVCDVAQDACIEIGGCGDGITDPSKGEICDDGNTRDGDGCSAKCDSKEVCGNMVMDDGELCDDGNTQDGDGCSTTCQPEQCGNKVIDPGEVCDDGNGVSGDGCSPKCTSNEACGNGMIDNYGPGSPLQEDCDPEPRFPLPAMDTETCNSNCKLPRCGDGHTNTQYQVDDGANRKHFEECDDGDGTPANSAGCNSNCTFSHCGDGNSNPLAGEECDEGGFNNDQNPNTCRTNCRHAHCGDHVTDGARNEKCDNGEVDTQNCNGSSAGSASCQDATCGDGYANTVKGEECDKGTADTDTCNGSSAGSASCHTATCGDEHKNAKNGEQCDEGAEDTDACNGNNAGSVSCHDAMCGDGYINAAHDEDCDTGNGGTDICTGMKTCQSCKCKSPP
jgi:cysteine-rich repeat protein